MPFACRLAFAAALLVVGGVASAAAQGGPIPLGELAAGWSRGQVSPVCGLRPSEADFPPTLRSEECAWPRVVQGRDSGAVTGTRGPDGVWQVLTWQRVVADRAAAGRLADSLGVALRGRGLADVRCPNAGQRRWQAAGVAVHFSTGAVFPDGLLRVVVFVTTLPGTLPDMLLCPGAPPLPPVPAGPPRRRAA